MKEIGKRPSTSTRRNLTLRGQFPQLAGTLLEAAKNAEKAGAFSAPTEDAVWSALDEFADVLAAAFARDQVIERDGAVSASEYENQLKKLQGQLRSFLKIHHFSYLLDERRALKQAGLADFRPLHRGHDVGLLAAIRDHASRSKASLVEALGVVDDLVEHARTARRLNGQAADFRARGQAVGKLAMFVQALHDEFRLTTRKSNDLAEYIWMRASLPDFAGKGETLRAWLSNQLKSFRVKEGITEKK